MKGICLSIGSKRSKACDVTRFWVRKYDIEMKSVIAITYFVRLQIDNLGLLLVLNKAQD